MPSEFSITTAIEEQIPILHIAGEITSESEEELLGAYDRIPGERKNRVILHFSETRYINSSGIAILIGVINRANEVKGRVEFAGLSTHFRKVMDIVGLTDFVKVYDSLQDALQASSANQS